MDPVVLVPRPREADLTSTAVPDATPVTEVGAPDLPPQGYDLVVAADRIELRHADAAGLRYGRQTLEQLRRAGLCEGRMRDWPDLPTRGVMVDISRDRVPDRGCLAVLADRLERLRVNHLELYTEHTYAHAGHELVWRNASPITPADLRWYDAYCAERGIELVANRNCFGHFERWLAHEPYRWRAADPSLEVPRSLAPTEENAELALSLVAEITDELAATKVNIGCDEVFELHGQRDVFLEHLSRLLDGTRALGLRPAFWADMVQAEPAAAADRVGDATALLWHYEAPMPPEAADLMADVELAPPFDSVVADWMASGAHLGFGPRAERFGAAGLDWWACPGASGWNSIVGRWSNARDNLLDAVDAALAHGASGLLITEWGDNGHTQPPTVMLPAVTYGAALAWCRSTNADLDVAEALDRHVLPDAGGRAGAALLAVGDVYARTGVITPNGSALHTAAVGNEFDGFGEPSADALAGVVRTLDEAADAFAAARFTDHDAHLSRRELVQACRLARHGAWRLAAEHGVPAPGPDELAADHAAVVEEQQLAWLGRSRPGGLLDSLARLRARARRPGGEAAWRQDRARP